MRARALTVWTLVLFACTDRPASTQQPAGHTSAVAMAHTTAATAPAAGGRTFIVFADVTRSLTDEEQRSVIENVQRVVDVLPARAHFVVLPILEDVERSRSIFDGRLPDIKTTSDAVAMDTQRATWRKQVAVNLEAVLHGPPHGRNLTCISGALRKAEELATDLGGGVEIVLVSDMLEDCTDSLLRGPLKLQKTSISKELERAESLPAGDALLNLNGASVTVLLPTVPTSGQRVARPPVHELKAFWRAILDRCGDRPADYRFGTGVPQRLLDYKPHEEGGL